MNKKILISLLIILLSVASFFDIIDKTSSEQLDKSFKRSLAVFAIARGLNGMISVIQGTEIYATPAGVGVNFAVGQIVDPMNDMLERFSFVMLISSVSLGVQEIMLEISNKSFLKLILILFATILLFMIWIDKIRYKRIFSFVLKIFIILSFLRFIIPLIVLSSELVYDYILEPKYIESKNALIFSSLEIENIIIKVESNTKEQIVVKNNVEKSTLKKMQNYFSETIDSLNISKKLESLKLKLKNILQNLDDKFEHSINYILVLITIFIVQSILLPLFSLWIFIRLFKNFLNQKFVL